MLCQPALKVTKKMNTVSWSDIPIDLLETIAKGIDTSIDLRSLRTVCASWRSSLPLPSPLCLKLPSPSNEDPITLVERPIYHLRLPDSSTSSCKGRLVKVEEKKLNKLSHVDLLSSTSEAIHYFPKVINFSNFGVFQVSKAYGVKYVDPTNIKIIKIVIGDYFIMAILDERRLVWMELGDSKWARFSIAYYSDIAFRKGKFYAVNSIGRVYEIDLSSRNLKRIKSPLDMADLKLLGKYAGEKLWHLVESFGDLFLVDTYHAYQDSEEKDQNAQEKLFPSVYKLVDGAGDGEPYWADVKTLGNRALFLGDDCCFSVSADLPGIIENCIYFRKKNSVETLIYELGKADDVDVRPLSSFQGYSQIFRLP